MNFVKLKNLNKVFIIAEIGNNHEGNFNLAKKLIYQASRTGADAVKFQTFKTEKFIRKVEKKRFKQLKKFQFSYDQFIRLKKIAHSKKLKFISTPLDIDSCKFLIRHADIIKIASSDNNFFPLIELVLKSRKPVIISTGMINSKDLDYLIKFIKKIKSSTGFQLLVDPISHMYLAQAIIDYVEDSCNTFANIVDNFIPGEVYNVGGRPEWEMDIKQYSDLVLKVTGKNDSLVEYKDAEAFTTKIKTVDFSRAIKDLNHNPVVDIKQILSIRKIIDKIHISDNNSSVLNVLPSLITVTIELLLFNSINLPCNGLFLFGRLNEALTPYFLSESRISWSLNSVTLKKFR